MKNKIGFLKIRSSHTVVTQIYNLLYYTFPQYDLEVIDVKKILRNNFHLLLINLIVVIKIYGFKTLFYPKDSLYNHFFGTPYIFKKIKALLEKKFNGSKYIFTIQDCSLFDGSIKGAPHFVYTDNTVLLNKDLPDFCEKIHLLTREWIELERTIYSNASAVFTRTNRAKNSIVKDYFCNQKNVKAIYYAPYIESEPKTFNKLKYKSKNILFIGNQWKLKGGPQLIKAFQYVLKEIPCAQVFIIGCNPHINIPNIKTIGHIKREEISKFYENSSIFCLPTRGEPLGTVFIEAMRYSLPVIGTKTGALHEFIFDDVNGYLVSVDDAYDLANKIICLLNDPIKCARFGSESFKIYNQKFSFDVVSNSLKKHITSYIS